MLNNSSWKVDLIKERGSEANKLKAAQSQEPIKQPKYSESGIQIVDF